jgi:hypothetical protein
VEYLGHAITSKGVRPKEALLDAIRGAPTPENKEQLRSFLGLAEYVSKFIQNFAAKVIPLRELLKQNVKFMWEAAHTKAFQDLKDEISLRPTLSAFDCTDAVKRC